MRKDKKMDYIKKMDEIISEKKKKGLVGIRFCILPESDRYDSSSIPTFYVIL